MKKKKVVFPYVPTPEPDKAGEGIFSFRWSKIQRYRERRWLKIVKRYEKHPNDFYSAFRYLQNHPIFYHWPSDNLERSEKWLINDRGIQLGVDMMVARVNPRTGKIDDKHKKRNIKTEVWVELMVPWWGASMDHVTMHWWTADTGGATYEEAIINLARNVHKKIGNDRRVVDKEYPMPDENSMFYAGQTELVKSIKVALSKEKPVIESPYQKVKRVREERAAESPYQKVLRARQAAAEADPQRGCGVTPRPRR